MTVSAFELCTLPRAWPGAPTEFSVSSLVEIEECPRRWSLRNAEYAELWERLGYPAMPTSASLAGSAVHSALARIARELVRAGCETAAGARAVEVMRALGGCSKVLEDAILALVEQLASNPRASTKAHLLKLAVMDELPELRLRLQKLLSRIKLEKRPPAGSAQGRISAARRALQRGSYAELELRAAHIGWRGTVDLLTLTESECEIRDFKTGSPEESHVFQLRVYALLWRFDSALNPHAIAASRLVLSYAELDEVVQAPTEVELAELEADLTSRRDAAATHLAMRPPPARPAPDKCRWCAVRHLCADYWSPGALNQIQSEASANPLEDIELEVGEPEGPGAWSAIVSAS